MRRQTTVCAAPADAAGGPFSRTVFRPDPRRKSCDPPRPPSLPDYVKRVSGPIRPAAAARVQRSLFDGLLCQNQTAAPYCGPPPVCNAWA